MLDLDDILEQVLNADTFAIKDESIIRQPPRPSKEARRRTERLVKKIAPESVGKFVEKLNNLKDTLENVDDAVNPRKAGKRLAQYWLEAMTVEEAKKRLPKGAHIAVDKGVYSHHAIYDGTWDVIEFDDGEVQCNTIENFANGSKIYQIHDQARYSPDEIVERAYSRLGESGYSILFNNCEHFANWCRYGD